MADEPNQKTDANDATGDGTERWVLFDWRDNSFGCGFTIVLLAWWAVIAEASAALQDRYWLGETINHAAGTLALTAAVIGMVHGRLWAIEVDEEGVKLEYRRLAKWQVSWQEIASWRPEMKGTRNRLTALLVTDSAGNEQRLSLGWYPLGGDQLENLLQAIEEHAPDGSRLPAIVSPKPRWRVFLALAVLMFAFWFVTHAVFRR